MVLVVWGFLILKKERSVTEATPYWNLLLNLHPHLPYHLQGYRGVSQAGCCERSLSQALNWQAGRQWLQDNPILTVSSVWHILTTAEALSSHHLVLKKHNTFPALPSWIQGHWQECEGQEKSLGQHYLQSAPRIFFLML